MGNNPQRIFDFKWTHETIENFWNLVALQSTKYPPTEEWFAFRQYPMLKEILQYIKKGSRVLDIGCGDGHMLGQLLKKGYGAYGLDLSQRFIEASKKAYTKAVVKKGTVKEIPFSSDFFDCVCSVDVLEHLLREDIFIGTREIWRVLKNGGYYILMTNNDEKLHQTMTICPNCGAWFNSRQHLQSFTLKDVTKAVEGAKFKIIKAGMSRSISDHLLSIILDLWGIPRDKILIVARKLEGK